MTFLGADTSKLRSIADVYRDAAARIEGLLDDLSYRAQAVGWTGPDADALRSELHTAHRQGINTARRWVAIRSSAESTDQLPHTGGA